MPNPGRASYDPAVGSTSYVHPGVAGAGVARITGGTASYPAASASYVANSAGRATYASARAGIPA